jgi:hypothetical protein
MLTTSLKKGVLCITQNWAARVGSGPLGRVKTKSDLVVMPSEDKFLRFFAAPLQPLRGRGPHEVDLAWILGELIPGAGVWLQPGITPCVKTRCFM